MKKLYILLALIALTTACKEDIPLNADNTVGVLCANGFIYSESDSNYLLITETGLRTATIVNTALVELTINGQLVEEISVCDHIPGRYNIKTVIHDGDQVRFDIHNLDKHAYFEGVMPNKVDNFDVTYTIEKDKAYHEWYGEQANYADMFRFDVTFKDLSPEKHYYRLYSRNKTTKAGIHKVIDWVPDSFIDEDGQEWTTMRDSIWYLYDTTYIRSKVFYEGELLLTDEDFTVENDFMEGTYNDCHVFKNSRFAGGQCNLKFYERTEIQRTYNSETYDTKYSVIIPSTIEFHDPDSLDLYENYNNPYGIYNCEETVGIESIDEDAYYYYKAINNYRAGKFDYQEITGAIKMHTNIYGGSGNIILSSRVTKTFTIYKDETPKPVYVPWKDDPNDILYYK